MRAPAKAGFAEMPMTYRSWDDEGLRCALDADPSDVDAILEAAERFRKQENVEDKSDKKHEFDMGVECPECGHEWDTYVDVLDFLPDILS